MARYKATRKKSPERKGFSVPSRKQRDWEKEKTGDQILFIERRLSRTNGDIVTAGNNLTLYTCPSGKRAKIVHAGLSTKVGEGYIQLQIVTGTTFLLHTYQATSLTYDAEYSDGVDLEPGDTVSIYCGSEVGNVAIGTLQVVEDDVSPGYFIQL